MKPRQKAPESFQTRSRRRKEADDRSFEWVRLLTSAATSRIVCPPPYVGGYEFMKT